MASRNELIKKRISELLKKGYPAGVVNLAMDWASGSAEGMANYVLKEGFSNNEDNDVEKLAVKFLPRYLKDSENWIKSFGHEPKSL